MTGGLNALPQGQSLKGRRAQVLRGGAAHLQLCFQTQFGPAGQGQARARSSLGRSGAPGATPEEAGTGWKMQGTAAFLPACQWKTREKAQGDSEVSSLDDYEK